MGRNPLSITAISHVNAVTDTLDAQIVQDAARFLNDGEKMQLDYAVQNTLRTIGTRHVEPYCPEVRDAEQSTA